MRLLVKYKKYETSPIKEVIVLEYSPNDSYFKLKFEDDLTLWCKVDEYEILCELNYENSISS